MFNSACLKSPYNEKSIYTLLNTKNAFKNNYTEYFKYLE